MSAWPDDAPTGLKEYWGGRIHPRLARRGLDDHARFAGSSRTLNVILTPMAPSCYPPIIHTQPSIKSQDTLPHCVGSEKGLPAESGMVAEAKKRRKARMLMKQNRLGSFPRNCCDLG